MGFYECYSAVFDAIKTALEYVPAVPPEGEDPGTPASGVESIKTVVLGERFTVGDLPKAIINAEPSPMGQAAMGDLLEVKVRGSIVLVILEYEPEDWFENIISVMGDVVDALLADRSLGGICFDLTPTGFSPGEIKFQEKTFFGGVVRWEAILHHEP
jgi:hypothetical protein